MSHIVSFQTNRIYLVLLGFTLFSVMALVFPTSSIPNFAFGGKYDSSGLSDNSNDATKDKDTSDYGGSSDNSDASDNVGSTNNDCGKNCNDNNDSSDNNGNNNDATQTVTSAGVVKIKFLNAVSINLLQIWPTVLWMEI